MKILIAEDDPVSRRVLETTLAKWGYEVVTTTNGFFRFGIVDALGIGAGSRMREAGHSHPFRAR